jgi:hypothetical protein
MNKLDVPWDKIKKSVEEGVPIVKVAELFSIRPGTIKQKSYLEKWSTPKRKSSSLKREIEDRGNRVAGLQGGLVLENKMLEEQLKGGELTGNSKSKSQEIDFEQATKEYRTKGVLKMARLLDGAILAPPKTYKDLDIADKMMRRLLGIDDNEGKSNTIVSLQLVNDRLRADSPLDIIEGDFIEESVPEASFSDPLQSKLTGAESAPPSGEVPEEGQGLSRLDYSADSPALRAAE